MRRVLQAATGLVAYLSDPNLVATIFAPSNTAFTQFFTDSGLTAEAALGQTYLITVVCLLNPTLVTVVCLLSPKLNVPRHHGVPPKP